MQMADKIVLRSVAADPPYLVDDKGGDHPPSATNRRALYEKTGRIPTARGHRRRRGRARVLPVWLAGRPCAAMRGSDKIEDENGIIAEHSRVLEASKQGLEKALITLTPGTRGPSDIFSDRGPDDPGRLRARRYGNRPLSAAAATSPMMASPGGLPGIALENGGQFLGSGDPSKSAMSPQPAGRTAKARPWAAGSEIGIASVAAARLDGRRRRLRFTSVGRQALHVIGHRR